MSPKNNRSKLLKVGLTILLILLLFLAGIQIFLSFYLDDLVQNRLVNTVSEQTMNQYQLDIGELTLSVWNRNMELHRVSLHPTDSSSTAPIVDFDQFSISGIEFLPYLLNGIVRLGDVQFINPTVTLTENSPDSLTFLNPSTTSSSNRTKPLNFFIDRFIVGGGSLNIQTSDLRSPRAELRNFDLAISGIRIDSTSRRTTPYFGFESVSTATGIIRYLLNDGLYAIESTQTVYSSAENIAKIDSLKLIPQYPRYEFSRHIGHQKDRISLTVGQLQFGNLDIEALKKGKLIADKFSIDSADLDIFRSKLLPDGPEQEKIFPHMAFKNLKFPITIDTIAINQSEISYSEHLPNVDRSGTVTFANVNGVIANVTNDSTILSGGHDITLDVTSDVMGAAELDVHFVLPMNDNGSHSARGTLGSMQATKLNPILEPVGLVRADRGNIHSLQFLMNLGADSATGWTQLIYSDLKIDVLDSKNVNDGGRRRLISFLANVLKIHKNNNRNPYRRGEIAQQRDHNKSIFSYWWKSLSTGLKDNVGL